MNDQGRPQFLEQRAEAGAIAHIHFVVNKPGNRFLEAALVPTRVSGGAEENRPLIIVESVNGETLLVQEQADLRSNQTGGAGNKGDLAGHAELELYRSAM